MKKIKLTKIQGVLHNSKVVGVSRKIVDKMSEADKEAYRLSHIPKIQPDKKSMDKYGIPHMRGCAFPSDPNPCEKRGKHLGNIHKMYKFKSMTPKAGA